MIQVDINTFGIPPRTTTQVRIGTGPSVPLISIGSQNIEGPRRSIIPQEARNTKPLDDSINWFPAKHKDPTPNWSKIIRRKLFTNKSSDVYSHSQMNFVIDTVFSKNPNNMNFRLSPVNTTDKLGSVIIPTNRVKMPKNGSNWLHPGHDIEEAAADGVSETRANNHYNFKSDFEAMREIQDFEQENISMSQPTLD